jgi:sugar lactone lactonase YvrE
MPRSLLIACATLLSPDALRAQDMPLSQILIDGEGWKKIDGEKPIKKGTGQYASGAHGFRWNTQPGQAAVFHGYPGDPGIPKRFPIPLKEPTGLTFSPDGGTLFVADAGGEYIWAFRMSKFVPGFGAPYCPLRIAKAKDVSEVAGLTTDKDGRIYAATPLGIQVFDPTGRLCGVMQGPPSGKNHSLVFEDDLLTCWTDNGKYTRKLKTSGVK